MRVKIREIHNRDVTISKWQIWCLLKRWKVSFYKVLSSKTIIFNSFNIRHEDLFRISVIKLFFLYSFQVRSKNSVEVFLLFENCWTLNWLYNQTPINYLFIMPLIIILYFQTQKWEELGCFHKQRCF